MTVQPQTLMNLYNQGIIDHVDLSLCQSTPMTQSGMMQMSGMGTGYSMPGAYSPAAVQMNATQYLNNAQNGYLYKAYDNRQDSFIRRVNNNHENRFSIMEQAYGGDGPNGKDVDFEERANGSEGKKIRQSLTDAAGKTTESVINSPTWVKGILAGGITATTLCLLFRRGKKPTSVQNKSFFSKLNPVNWFKK